MVQRRYFWWNYFLNNCNLLEGLLRKGCWYNTSSFLTTISKCIYIFWLDMFVNNSLRITFILLSHDYQSVSSWSTRFLSQNKSRNWASDLNKNNTMYVVPFSFCCIYYFFSLFVYTVFSACYVLFSQHFWNC